MGVNPLSSVTLKYLFYITKYIDVDNNSLQIDVNSKYSKYYTFALKGITSFNFYTKRAICEKLLSAKVCPIMQIELN